MNFDRKRIKNMLREELLKEKKPDKELVDSILDKVSKSGYDQLLNIEKKYLNQASKEDVDPELENEIEEFKKKKNEIIKKIEKGEEIKTEELKEQPQEIIDEYIQHKIDQMGRSKSDIIPKKIFDMGSQKVIDAYIVESAKIGKILPPVYYKSSSEHAINKAAAEMVEKNKVDPLQYMHLVKLASQDIIDKYLSIRALKNGIYVTPDILNKASEEIKEYYIQQMSKLKGEDVIKKLY